MINCSKLITNVCRSIKTCIRQHQSADQLVFACKSLITESF